jgi:uncharacterized protein (DUF427 family)
MAMLLTQRASWNHASMSVFRNHCRLGLCISHQRQYINRSGCLPFNSPNHFNARFSLTHRISTQHKQLSNMPHATATVNGTVIADTDTYEIVEGNVYFPPASIKSEFFKKTETHTHCGWKGDASYYTLDVAGQEFKDAAWYYPEPYEKAKHIKDFVAFCK